MDDLKGIAFHSIYQHDQVPFSETLDQTNYGRWYYATNNTTDLTYRSGACADVRGEFSQFGSLDDSDDTSFRDSTKNQHVFAFAVDLGKVATNSVRTLFSIGLAQKQAIQFQGHAGAGSLRSSWAHHFRTDTEALAFFHHDYAYAAEQSINIDDQIRSDALAVAGPDYAALTTLVFRQAFSALEIARYRKEDLVFLKEISSNGNMQTVDVLYPFHTILLHINPRLLKLSLDPLFINQESGHFPQEYSIHDLGLHFPNATGHDDGKDEAMPIEESANMLIMTLAYTQRADDSYYLVQHYKILRQWAEYLVKDTLHAPKQLSTDDFMGELANQTNLALKGIIGIKAMAVIARTIGNDLDEERYSSIAHDYIIEWQSLSISRDDELPHATLAYGQNDSHGLLYNLYVDKQLGLNLVPEEIYEMQSNFYPAVKKEYGVPLDTRQKWWVKSDWQLWAAAVASDETRDLLIQDVANFARTTISAAPLSDLYNANNARYVNRSQLSCFTWLVLMV